MKATPLISHIPFFLITLDAVNRPTLGWILFGLDLKTSKRKFPNFLFGFVVDFVSSKKNFIDVVIWPDNSRRWGWAGLNGWQSEPEKNRMHYELMTIVIIDRHSSTRSSTSTSSMSRNQADATSSWNVPTFSLIAYITVTRWWWCWFCLASLRGPLRRLQLIKRMNQPEILPFIYSPSRSWLNDSIDSCSSRIR